MVGAGLFETPASEASTGSEPRSPPAAIVPRKIIHAVPVTGRLVLVVFDIVFPGQHLLKHTEVTGTRFLDAAAGFVVHAVRVGVAGVVQGREGVEETTSHLRNGEDEPRGFWAGRRSVLRVEINEEGVQQGRKRYPLSGYDQCGRSLACWCSTHIVIVESLVGCNCFGDSGTGPNDSS